MVTFVGVCNLSKMSDKHGGHEKFAFHGVNCTINTRKFATNSLVTGTDNADSADSRFMVG